MERESVKRPDSLIAGSDLPKETPPDELIKAFDAFSKTSAELIEYYAVLERRIAELTEQLERSRRLAAIGEMAATLAHEIRNPLAGISLSVSMLEKRVKDTGARELIENIRAGVNRMESIIGDILNFAQDITLNKVRVSWKDISRRIRDYLIPALEGKEITLTISKEDLEFSADPDYLERALLNVLDNAVDAVGDEGQIWLSCEEGGNKVVISVRDTGPGFSEEVMGKLCEPFFTTKTKGTGLGLAITSRIVEAHGGEMEFRNWENGAEVVIWLPY